MYQKDLFCKPQRVGLYTLLLLLLLAVTATYAPQTYAQDTFRDIFDSQDYAGDDGTVSWSANWAEISDDGIATSGSVKVDQDGSFPAYSVKLDQKDDGLERELDLSSYDTATLSFTYRREKIKDGSLTISVFDGSIYNDVATIAGTGTAVTDASYQTMSGIDITAHMASNSKIRFLRDSQDNKGDAFWIDDVEVSATSTLPVGLISFEALVDGPDVLLQWATASETNNAGFEIQSRNSKFEIRNSDWTVLGFVDGYGTTELPRSYQYRVEDLAPGRYAFCLKQIDYDGTFEYSPEVEVVVEMVERFVVEPVYPNPFNPQAQFRFAVQRQQQVEVALYDMLGRRVKLLYAGSPPLGQMQEVRIDGSDLPSGLYLVRLIGETFVETQTVTLLK